MTSSPRRAVRTCSPWGRVARVVAVLAFVGLFAVDCCNATGDWAWVDVTRAPHMAAVTGHGVVTAPVQRSRNPWWALLPSGATVLVAAVLVLARAEERSDRVRERWRSTRPPGRGPPRTVLLGAPS